MSYEQIAHVSAQIASASGRFEPKQTPQGVKVKCPFHGGGNERTPSCSINLTGNASPVGYYFCFGCRDKGSWNKFADATGLQGFRAADQVHDLSIFSYGSDSAERRTKSKPLETWEDLPWANKRPWRKIQPNILRRYYACESLDPDYSGDFIYFPVLVNDAYLGGIYARRVVKPGYKEAGILSYINTANAFSKRALFGYNQAKKRIERSHRVSKRIVEGPRDVMKTHQVGGRAVGLIGASVSDRKIELIEALDPPAIIIATDPDDAGKLARERLAKRLHYYPVYHAKFPEGKDPGNFTERSYSKMLRRMGL